MSPNRPIGISIIAVFYFIGVVSYMALLSLAIFSAGTLTYILSGLSPGGVGPDALLSLGRFLAIYFGVMLIVVGLLGYGMWKLRNWARWITIVITAASLVITLFGVVELVTSPSIPGLVLVALRLGLCVLILWYLFSSGVRDAFSKQTAAITGSEVVST